METQKEPQNETLKEPLKEHRNPKHHTMAQVRSKRP
jgi:hypothetical protein